MTHFTGRQDRTATPPRRCVEGEDEFTTAVEGSFSGSQTVMVNPSTGIGGFDPSRQSSLAVPMLVP